MRQVRRTAISLAAAQVAVLWSGLAFGQQTTTPAAKEDEKTIVISGRRAALESAAAIKRNAEEVVDSVVAEEMGKLPDRSVTEVLQRVVGVTIERTMARNDPDHYSVEGSGVNVRGLSMVRSELNGRDTFSANGGRALGFEDVPPELMAAVEVYKNPSASRIEGAIGGLVNLRTAMPFDYAGFKFGASADVTYSELPKKRSPSGSLLVSNRWKTELGEIGALVSVAKSRSRTRSDQVQVEPYHLIDPNKTDTDTTRNTWVPTGVGWRALDYTRDREGLYGALQWRKNEMKSSLSYFQSDYRMEWTESAIFGGMSNPYGVGWDSASPGLGVSPGAIIENGVFKAGTLINPGSSWNAGADYGSLNFGGSTRYSARKSSTKELAWNFNWRVNDTWTLDSDFQLLRSKTRGDDFTVGTGTLLPSMTVDLTGAVPKPALTPAEQAQLLDPNNNYWGFTMEHLDRATATGKAWRGEATMRLDHPVLHDLQFGVRLTEKDFHNTQTPNNYNWQVISATWQWGSLARFLTYPNTYYQHDFQNFFGGGVSTPSTLLAAKELARNGFPEAWKTLHSYNPNAPWQPSTLGVDPAGENEQHEKTQAAYAQLRFGFEDWKLPLDGNLGLRAVRTDQRATGYLVAVNKVPKDGVPGPGVVVPNIPSFAIQMPTAVNQYNHVLPSLNLKLKASKELQFRFAAAQAISRPDYSQLQAVTRFNIEADSHSDSATKQTIIDRVRFTGEDQGNPMLKPVRANQLDATAEWYFSKNGSLTLALFDKRLKDLLVKEVGTFSINDDQGNAYPFTYASSVNGAKGYARGLEIAFQRYMDMLPGAWGGIGLQANYTYIDSKVQAYQPITGSSCGTLSGSQNLLLNANGCDTNGVPFDAPPLAGLSKNAYNLAVLYDYGPISARLAYSWRSRYLQGVNLTGTGGTNGMDANGNSVTFGLPVWNKAYGQLDGGITYKLLDSLSLSLEGQNLNRAVSHTLMQQHIGLMTRGANYTGRRYVARVSYSY